MSLVKPNILAEALGLTTDALRKRRYRVTKSVKLNTNAYDYTVTGSGRGMPQPGSLLRTNTIIKNHETLSIGLKPIAKSETEQYLFWILERFN